MSQAIPEELDKSLIDKIIEKYRDSVGSLMNVLESLQDAHPNKYLPKGVLRYVSEQMKIPLSKIYNVITFYAFFNLKPQGKHCITVCRGTTCHTKRSKVLLENIKRYLQLKDDPEEESEKIFLTTEDRSFTLRTVACFGQCALAPVVEIDGILYGNVRIEGIKQLIQKIKEGDMNDNRRN